MNIIIRTLLVKTGHFIKKNTSSLFFLIFAFILGFKTLGSEFYFLVKLLGVLISIILTLFIFHVVIHRTKDLKIPIKQLQISLFFTLSLFMILNLPNSQLIASYLELKVTGGILLFIIYLFIFVIFKIDLSINSIVSLISLCQIPVFALGKFTYSEETFAVFGYLTLIVSAILLILKLRNTYETD